MPHRIAVRIAVALFLATALLAEEPEIEQVMEVKGEIVDLHCHIDQGASGPDHAGCAAACIKRGVPAALLAEDGKLYLLLDPKGVSIAGKLEGKIGKPVTVRGTEVSRTGLSVIRVSEVE